MGSTEKCNPELSLLFVRSYFIHILRFLTSPFRQLEYACPFRE